MKWVGELILGRSRLQNSRLGDEMSLNWVLWQFCSQIAVDYADKQPIVVTVRLFSLHLIKNCCMRQHSQISSTAAKLILIFHFNSCM